MFSRKKTQDFQCVYDFWVKTDVLHQSCDFFKIWNDYTINFFLISIYFFFFYLKVLLSIFSDSTILSDRSFLVDLVLLQGMSFNNSPDTPNSWRTISSQKLNTSILKIHTRNYAFLEDSGNCSLLAYSYLEM